MTIVPDTKDWTWVLTRACPECGFDASTFPASQTGGRLRANAKRWESALSRPDAATRPAPSVWSPLEYACHVRDVCRLYLRRLELMLTEDDPLYPNWDQDATAVEERYAEQEPGAVSAELQEAAQALADRFDGLDETQWQRTGRRSDGASFTVDTFARYFLHDVEHHAWDVRAS